jgi:hypothetical protein
LYCFHNLVAQSETFRKQKLSEQSQFWLPKQRSVVDPDQDPGQAQCPSIQEKLRKKSCFELLVFLFSLGRAEDFPEALTGASEKKFNFPQQYFFRFCSEVSCCSAHFGVRKICF